MAKILSYNEFCEVIPERTKKFIDEILPYFYYYIDQEHSITIEGYTFDNLLKSLVIMLNYEYEQQPANKTQLFLGSENFTPRPTLKKNDNDNYNPNQVFLNSTATFCIFNQYENYSYLTPENIILNCCKEYDKSNSSTIKFLFDNNYDGFRRFISGLSSYTNSLNDNMKQDAKEEFYEELSIEVINYIETVAKIHAYINSYIKNNNYNKEIIINDKDIFTISILIALYFVQNPAVTILKENGLELQSVLKYLGLGSLNKNEIDKQDANIFVLTKYYKKFIFDGKNKDKDNKEITIEGIAENLFDRKLNQNIVFEKILSNCNSSYNRFKNFDTQIEHSKQYEEANRTQEKMKQFYQNLPQKTIEYIELVSKIYTLIMNKMTAGTHNKEVLFNSEDADTLSLLLALYFSSPKSVALFKEFGIEYDKVLAYLQIDISKEEIDKIPVNIEALTNVFQRFIFEGVNKGKKSNDITLSMIAKNLCDREFNRTLIVERIIREFNKELDIQSNFLSQLEIYLSTKEEVRKRKLEQKFYGELPASTIKFIKKAEKTFQFLNKSNRSKEFTIDDMIELSLILAYFNNSDSAGYADFIRNNVAVGNIYSKLNLSENNNAINTTTENIDNIYNNFGKYVFGGNNKDKPKLSITTDDIIKNAFSKNLNNSVSLSQLLGELGSSREAFANFDQKFEEYQAGIQKKKVADAKQTIHSITNAPTISYLSTVSKIVQTLEKLRETGTCNTKELKLDDDIREAAIMLGLFLEPNDISYFLQKRGISLEKSLEFLGISMDDFTKYAEKETDYLLIQEKFKNYIGYYWSEADIDSIAKAAFSSQGNLSDVAENIIGYCEQCYQTVSQEVITKQEVVKPLTKDEELVVFYNEPISIIDSDDFNSILNVGSNLAVHAKKISDNFSGLINLESQDSLRNEEVRGALEVFKAVLPKKKGFFSGKTISREEQERQITDNLSQLQRVYEYFTNKAETLTEQIAGYDYLIKYMSIFIYHWEEDIKVLESERDGKITLLSQRKTDGTYFDGNNDDIIANMVNSKLNHMQNSKLMWMQEYLKVKTMLLNHAASLNEVQHAVQTLLPITFIEKCISDGIVTERETINSISDMVGILENVMTSNTAAILENTTRLQTQMTPKQIEAISTEIRKELPAFVQTDDEPINPSSKQKIISNGN